MDNNYWINNYGGNLKGLTGKIKERANLSKLKIVWWGIFFIFPILILPLFYDFNILLSIYESLIENYNNSTLTSTDSVVAISISLLILFVIREIYSGISELIFLKEVLNTLPDSKRNKLVINLANIFQVIFFPLYPLYRLQLRFKRNKFKKKLEENIVPQLLNPLPLPVKEISPIKEEPSTADLLKEIDELLFGEKIDKYSESRIYPLLKKASDLGSFNGRLLLAELYMNYYDGIDFEYDLNKAEYYAELAFTSDYMNDEWRAEIYITLANIYALQGNDDYLDEDDALYLMLSALSIALELGHDDAERLLEVANDNFDIDWDDVKEYIKSNALNDIIQIKIKEGLASLPKDEKPNYNIGLNKNVIGEDTKQKLVDNAKYTKEMMNMILPFLLLCVFFVPVGIGIIIWGTIENEVYSPALYLLGLLVMGIPNFRSAVLKTLKTNERWNRILGEKYKATIDLDKKTIKVKKDQDVFFLIFQTILNLISGGIEVPFLFLKGLKEYSRGKKYVKHIEKEFNTII